MEINGFVKNATHGVQHKLRDAHGAVQQDQHQRKYRSQHRKKMKRSKPKPKGRVKRKKATSIPVITRRLFRLASERCRAKARFTCEVCGMVKGTLHPNTGKAQRVEAHHIMSRSNKDSSLKFDLRNLICLCTSCHKTSQFSAHKHGIWFAEWLRINKPEQHAWVLKHSEDTVNLKDRAVLKKIEENLKKPFKKRKKSTETQLKFDF